MLFGRAEMNGQLIDILIESVVIVDMTNYKNHWIKKKEDRAWLKDFVERKKLNKNMYPAFRIQPCL